MGPGSLHFQHVLPGDASAAGAGTTLWAPRRRCTGRAESWNTSVLQAAAHLFPRPIKAPFRLSGAGLGREISNFALELSSRKGTKSKA